jgi:hypothetical protein
MRATLLTAVAGTALSLAAATALAQSNAPETSPRSNLGQSETAPGQMKPPATSASPGRSESAPGQNRSSEATQVPGPSERAPGQVRDGGSKASSTGSVPDQMKRAGEAERSAPPTAARGDSGQSQASGQGASDQRRRSDQNAGQQSGPSGRSTAGADQRQQPSAGPSRRDSSQTSSSSTDQQGSRAGATATRQQDQSTQSATTGRSGTQGSTASQSRDTETTGAISGTVKLNQEQRTQITQAFTSTKVQPVNNVSFSVSVGSTVTDSVRLYDVPPEVVRLVPQFRGYRYLVVRDEIVIVEPRTKNIVEVIHTSGEARTSASLRLNSEQRQLIRSNVKGSGSRTTVTRTEVREGVILPEDVELLDVPPTVVTEVPELRTFRYVVVGDEIAVVEPRTRRVIEIIEE